MGAWVWPLANEGNLSERLSQRDWGRQTLCHDLVGTSPNRCRGSPEAASHGIPLGNSVGNVKAAGVVGETVSPQVELEDEEGENLIGSLKLEGFDFCHAQGGVDLRLNRTMAVGPYLLASLGQYRQVDSQGIPSDGRRLHVWLQPGVRLQLHF